MLQPKLSATHDNMLAVRCVAVSSFAEASCSAFILRLSRSRSAFPECSLCDGGYHLTKGGFRAGDGHRAAYHMLHMGRVQGCPDPGAFTRAMMDLFGRIADIHAPGGIDLDQVGACPGTWRVLQP